jgi:hypothetical protein
MSTLIEQLLLDDPSQVVERGYFFENSSEGVGIIIDRSDEYINNKVFNKVFDKLVESSEHLKEILNTHLSKVRNINIEFSSEVPEEFRDRKEELVIDSFYYQINFNVDFILDYFENISIIYLKICPSFKCSKSGRVLDIGVTGYLCYESSGRISRFHQEKLSFKPRTKVITQDLFLTKVKNLPIWITNIFKYNNDYNGMFSLFKKEIAEKLAQLINVD